MSGLLYLLKTSTKNRILKSLKKPATYIWVIFIIAYLIFVMKGLGDYIDMLHVGNSSGFALLVSLGIFALLPTNIVTYAKRKGLIFKQSDVHFIFTSPVNPKFVLVNAQGKQILMSMLFHSIVVVMGVIYFNVPIITMILYFILAFCVENILESSIMILLYGNETLSEKKITILCRSLYVIIGLLLCFGAYLFMSYEASWKVIGIFLAHPLTQCVPILGWNIAFIRLLILGPTTVNVVCTVLYCASAIVLFVFAYKMKCTGEYYEDAMTFADDYAVKITKARRGQLALPFKQKLGKATVEYKGKYAKAIFYRQLLEYKKNKFFIFGIASVASLVIGIAIAVFGYFNYEEIGKFKVFIIPGVSAYISFIFSGYATKWSKEISNPYTFLLPDFPAKKLWYATLIEHIRAMVDGALITIPAAITLRLNIVQIILTILIYVCLQSNKLYLNVVTDAFIGKYLGRVGKQFFRMFVQGIMISISVASAVVSGMIFGSEVGYIIMIIVSAAITALLALVASKTFENMESID
ncbi:MAG: putative ABC exporter domain-containing protein [Lachnotalea sp.]